MLHNKFASLFFLIFLIVYSKASSQSCLPQGIEFNNQTQIDSFQINYPGCTEIEGNVKIRGSGINDLSELSILTSIGGDLRFELNPDLTSLIGLSSLNSIGGDLVFAGNFTLTSLSGLDNLTTIGRDLVMHTNGLTSLSGLGGITFIDRNLYIIGNHSLTDLSGLENIKSIDSALVIEDNDGLIDLSGLDSLTFIGENLLIAQNHSLKNLNGLQSLVYIKQGLAIWFNDALTSLSSLDSLTYTRGLSIWFNPLISELNGLKALTLIGGNLHIDNNNSLKSLSDLISVTSIDGVITIINNNSLTSLSGLDNITANSITDLYIGNNSSLSTCAVKSVCDFLVSPNGVDSIYNNAPGCNNEEEVKAACTNTGMELNIKVFLQGPYSGNNMNVDLSNFLPNSQPYDTIPWSYFGMESLDSIPINMVDWVLIEIRDSTDYYVINDMRVGILLSNGYIIDTNLVEGIRFYNIDSGYYYVAIRHRNHISVMTNQPVYISSQTQIDFTDTTITKPYGSAVQAQLELDPGIWGMICGDINNDGKLKYSGPENDRMKIIQLITNVSGSTSITTVINGYYFEDLDINSEVKYSGPNNDGAIIIQNIISLTGSTSITSIYTCPVFFLYP